MPKPPAPDGDLGPELLPKPDFNGWVQPEAMPQTHGFAVRGYWVFGSKMNPRIRIRIRVKGTMYRIVLSPIGKESWPQRTVLERHLAREAALQAADFGAPQPISEGEQDDNGTENET